MLGNILPPYHSLQELNLDWILTKIKNMLRFLPDDGAVGQVLRRTPHGAEWSDEQGAGGSVTSVNGMQGAVVLGAADVGALPDTYTAPVDSVNGQTGAVVLSIPTDTADLTNTAGFVDAAGAAAAAPVQSVNGQTGAVVIPTGGAVDSVNGQTGTVVLDAADVGAMPDTYTAPVDSVNGQTGTVVLAASDVGALSNTQLTITQSTVAGVNNNTTFAAYGKIAFSGGYCQLTSNKASGSIILQLTNATPETSIVLINNTSFLSYTLYPNNDGSFTCAGAMPSGWYTAVGVFIIT